MPVATDAFGANPLSRQLPLDTHTWVQARLNKCQEFASKKQGNPSVTYEEEFTCVEEARKDALELAKEEDEEKEESTEDEKSVNTLLLPPGGLG